MSKQYGKGMSMVVLMAGMLVAARALAGDLDPTNAPGSTMHTLEEIYQKVADIDSPQALSATTTAVNAGYYMATTLSAVDVDLAEGNIKTGVTIFGIAGTLSGTPSPVPKTGQGASFATGDDGDLRKGLTWPVPRFTDNGNGTVTDNLTELIWLKTAYAFGSVNWTNALNACNTLTNGMHGLSDGSVAGDWRLPNVRELLSLINYGATAPALPSGYPFTQVQGMAIHWTSSTRMDTTSYAFGVSLYRGEVSYYSKNTVGAVVWPVRDGQ